MASEITVLNKTSLKMTRHVINTVKQNEIAITLKQLVLVHCFTRQLITIVFTMTMTHMHMSLVVAYT